MQIGFLDFYGGVLNVQQERSDLIANNIANADTPNYKAVDMPFDSALAAQLGASGAAQTGPEYRADAVVGLNGNDVSLDSERVEAAANGGGDGRCGDVPASIDRRSGDGAAPQSGRQLR